MKTNIIALSVLAALALTALLFKPATSTIQKDLSSGFTAFKAADLSQVERITVSKAPKAEDQAKEKEGDKEKSKEPPVLELKRSGSDDWVIPTAWSYPADKKKVKELLDELKKATAGEPRKAGKERSSHPRFKVDQEKGVVLALFDKKDQKLAKLVIGGDSQSRTLSSGSFIRFDDENDVWDVQASLRNKVISYPDKVEAKNFLEKVLFKLPDDHEAQRVTLVRPDHNVIVEKRVIDVVKAEEPKDAAGEGSIAEEKKDEKKDEKKPEVKKEDEYWVTSGTQTFKVDKAKEWDAKSVLTRDIRIEDAAEKKDPKDYGLDKPQLKVEIAHRKKDQKDAPEQVTTILFGNAIKEDKEGTDKGENKAYYVMLDGEGGSGRIYTVTKWDFNVWNKELKDFEKPPEPKKEEPKKDEKKDETKAAGEAAPGAPAPSAKPAAPGGSTPPPAPAQPPAANQQPPATTPPPAAAPPPAAEPKAGAQAPAPGAGTPPVQPPAPAPAPAPPAPEKK